MRQRNLLIKRIAMLLLAALYLQGAAWATGDGSEATLSPPEVSAVSAILIDGESGRILYEKNAQEERPIASITKIMTALVAIELGDLDDEVTIEREYTLTEGSSIYLKVGEVLTLRELLYGLLLESGNDAALAIAGHCAGSTEAFVKKMNETAAALGLTHTQFQNPSGLPDDGHYSTAEDMGRITRAAMENETFAEIFGTKNLQLGERYLKNHNKLLWNYEWTVGGKTGYTEEAGRTLVTCARQGDQWLIVVTLRDPDDWNDHVNLFEYGFSAYPSTEICSQTEEIASVPVKNGTADAVALYPAETLYYPLAEGETVETELNIPDEVKAPVAAEGLAGSVTYRFEEAVLGQVDLLYAESVEAVPLWKRALEFFGIDVFGAQDAQASGDAALTIRTEGDTSSWWENAFKNFYPLAVWAQDGKQNSGS